MTLSILGRIAILAAVANAPVCGSGQAQGGSAGSASGDAASGDASSVATGPGAPADASLDTSQGSAGAGGVGASVDGSAPSAVTTASADATASADGSPGAINGATAMVAGDGPPAPGDVVEPTVHPACGQLVTDTSVQYGQVIKGEDGFLIWDPSGPATLGRAVRAGGVRVTTSTVGSQGGAMYSIDVDDAGAAAVSDPGYVACIGLTFAVAPSGHVLTVVSDTSSPTCATAQVSLAWMDAATNVLQSSTMSVSQVFPRTAASLPNGGAVVAFAPIPTATATGFVVLLDATLAEKARWQVPSGVELAALAPLPNGTLMLVGSTGSSAPQIWLEALDESTLNPAWAPVAGGPGAPEDADVTASGNVVVEGYNPVRNAAGAPTFFLEEYDAAGKPVWSPRPEVPVTEDPVTFVAIQSDGTVFGTGGWVYKPCP